MPKKTVSKLIAILCISVGIFLLTGIFGELAQMAGLVLFCFALCGLLIRDRSDRAAAFFASRRPTAPMPQRTVDELAKFSALLKDGILTPEEFEQRKKKLLEGCHHITNSS